MSVAGTILPILFLAFLAESLTEYLFKPILERIGGPDASGSSPSGQGLYTRYVAAGVGVLLAVAYQVDILRLAGLSSGWPVVGYVITGILIGRGSNYLNDIADRWFIDS
jgi:hypothetical protein